MERHPNCSDRPRYSNGGTVASTPRYKRFMRKGPGLWFPALLVRFATLAFVRFLRNLLAVLRRFHLDEVDGHLAFGVHAVAHQNMHSYLRAVRPPGRALLDAGVGTNELVEAPGVDRLELYKVPGRSGLSRLRGHRGTSLETSCAYGMAGGGCPVRLCRRR